MEKKQNPADLSEQEKEVLLELIYVKKIKRKMQNTEWINIIYQNSIQLSFLSKRTQTFLNSKILLSWVLPGHLATLVSKRSLSQIVSTLMVKNLLLF